MTEGLFASLYQAGRPFALIDTRERRDYVNGHWFGSTNIPLSVLTVQAARLLPDRSFPVHLLDWQDRPSRIAADRLAQLGYQAVTLHKTSRPERFGAGFVKGEFVWSKAFGEVVAHLADLPEVTPADYLANHPDALLLDVRPTAEYAQFTIPRSQSLPNSLLLANMETLKNTGQTALLHCAGRTRSIIGACTLRAAGYAGPFAVFRGGTQAWQLDGHAREHGARRVFAREADVGASIRALLKAWDIACETVAANDLASFVAAHRHDHLFDVSDDAATGQMAVHGIVKISGTNLIQQTDRSIARYHVPVLLFDAGSGSRAAFAALWLKTMGYAVRVGLLDGQLVDAPKQTETAFADVWHEQLSARQLEAHLEAEGLGFDLRPSSEFRKAHLKGSEWQNISALLADGEPAPLDPLVIIGSDARQAKETGDLLAQHGWHISGVFGWDRAAFTPSKVASGAVRAPIDESALFAGRHHGNMQDSRDYLAWEEDLPGQIDAEILGLWTKLIGETLRG